MNYILPINSFSGSLADVNESSLNMNYSVITLTNAAVHCTVNVSGRPTVLTLFSFNDLFFINC